ncbi:hypothetical protein ALC62_15311 [Cyphomyrmex costatus]|uniref:Peptidase M12A domain-containing protein n=1 Tax=Cyphomyrmex costatus TaxID=456900 RepID=A0A151I7G7_9HYME|nr:hypothetical protein ALC62_15311 [Cyphomyrmex costatus]
MHAARVAFTTKHTGMFQRAGYDRYDPRLLEQMYGCPESDLSYGRPPRPVGPTELRVGGFFPVLCHVRGATKKPVQLDKCVNAWLLKYFRKHNTET